MASILPFPGRPAREAAPQFFTRAKALLAAGEAAQSAALDLTADGNELLEGSQPTPADNSMNGQALGSLIEALTGLIEANGVPAPERGILAALTLWRIHNRR